MLRDSDNATVGLRPREAAQLLGVSQRTLHTWMKQGIVPYCKIGRVVLFSRRELIRWLEEQAKPRTDANTEGAGDAQAG